MCELLIGFVVIVAFVGVPFLVGAVFLALINELPSSGNFFLIWWNGIIVIACTMILFDVAYLIGHYILIG